MEKMVVTKIKEYLIFTILGDLMDKDIFRLQRNILEKIHDSKTKGVMIDISMIDLVDTFMGRIISNTASMARLMGAETVLIGMKPSIAITLIELGLEIKGVHAALDVDGGMKILENVFQANLIKEAGSFELSGEGDNEA